MKKRFGQISTAHLFLVRGRKILLLRRFNTGYRDGQYSVPAGHIEENESARKTMVREAKEETGIRIKQNDLEMAHVMHRHENDKRIDFFFRAKKWIGKPQIKEPEKCDDLNWFEFDHLPKNTVPYIRQALNCYFKKIVYSEYGW